MFIEPFKFKYKLGMLSLSFESFGLQLLSLEQITLKTFDMAEVQKLLSLLIMKGVRMIFENPIFFF